MKKNWNCKWPEIYKNPKKHEELVRYEDPKNLIFDNPLYLFPQRQRINEKILPPYQK